MKTLLTQAGIVARDFFSEKILDKLIWGVD
jgi:hypothetical protein